MVIFQEPTQIAPVEILTESVLDDGDVKIKFLCHLHDTKRNNNRRIYDTDSLKRINAQLSPKVNARKLAGEMGHPIPSGDQASLLRRMATIDPNNVGVLFTKFKFNGNSIDAEAETLTNDKGRNLYSMIKDNVGIGFSYRGFGKVNSNGVTIPESIRSITYDVVFNESNNGAVIMDIITESEDVYGLLNELNEATQSFESLLMESEGIVETQNCPLGQCNIDNVKMLKEFIIESSMLTNNYKHIKLKLR